MTKLIKYSNKIRILIVKITGEIKIAKNNYAKYRNEEILFLQLMKK